MEKQRETYNRTVLLGKDDLSGTLYKKGLMNCGLISEDIIFTSLIDGELLNQI